MLLLICRALIHMLILEPALVMRNFPAIHRRVRTRTISPHSSPCDERQVLRALDLACAFYCKKVLCLQRSAAAVCLLRDCGISAQMVIGVRQTPFQAHAWAEVNGRCINDRSYIPSTYLELDRC